MQEEQVIKSNELAYFVVTPRFRTASKRYAWLNGIQAAAKAVELKIGPDGYIIYDVFVLK